MRILVVSQYFWPENFRVNDLVIELKNRGHEVTVFTGLPNYPDGKIFKNFKNNKSDYSQYEGVEVIRVPLIPRGNGGIRLILNYFSFVFFSLLLGPFKLKGKDFDVIFVFEPSPVTVGLPAILFKNIKKAPVFFWALDLWPETLEAIGVVKSKRVIKLIGRLVTYIYNRCDVLLAQSRSFIPCMQRYCDNTDKVHYFPSWAEDSFSNSLTETASEIPTTNENTFSVMFAGNIGDAQDFPSILNAAELLKDHKNIRWLIVGDGRMASWVKDECNRCGLRENFLMLGSYPLDRMSSFYASADALLVTLKNKEIFTMTIPGKVQSYLASAKPIIGMLNGEGANIIREAGAGYAVDASDSKSLACHILKMASLSPEERELLGISGRNFYKKEFDKKVLIDRLESFFISKVS